MYADLISDPINKKVLFPHEFLFLICNSLDRIELIKKLHAPKLKSKKIRV